MARRSVTIAALLAAVCLAAALAGCAPASSDGGSAAGGGTNAPKYVTLGVADAGTTAGVAVGGTVTVNLPGNPTTGYNWAVDGAMPPELQSQGAPTFATSGAAGQVGAGGEVTLKFTATKSGTGDLRLKYWRSFEPTAAPVKTWSAKIDVK
jgi:inhibitor of cysteine peptidase